MVKLPSRSSSLLFSSWSTRHPEASLVMGLQVTPKCVSSRQTSCLTSGLHVEISLQGSQTQHAQVSLTSFQPVLSSTSERLPCLCSLPSIPRNQPLSPPPPRLPSPVSLHALSHLRAFAHTVTCALNTLPSAPTPVPALS